MDEAHNLQIMKVYFNGSFVEKNEVHISPDDRGFYFADGIYEVARWYGGYFFAMKEHLDRMHRSLREIKIGFEREPDVQAIADQLVNLNGLSSKPALLYLQITRGAVKRVHLFPDPPVPPTVYIAVSEFTPSDNAMAKGISVITLPDERWSRCDIKSIGLLPNILAKQTAHERGAQEAFLLRNGLITEGTHSNIFGIRNGKLVTHPDSPFILPGITRKIVLDLCPEIGLSIDFTAIAEADIHLMDEWFITNTSGEVVPVTFVNGQPVGTGEPGQITMLLRNTFIRYREKRRS